MLRRQLVRRSGGRGGKPGESAGEWWRMARTRRAGMCPSDARGAGECVPTALDGSVVVTGMDAGESGLRYRQTRRTLDLLGRVICRCSGVVCNCPQPRQAASLAQPFRPLASSPSPHRRTSSVLSEHTWPFAIRSGGGEERYPDACGVPECVPTTSDGSEHLASLQRLRRPLAPFAAVLAHDVILDGAG